MTDRVAATTPAASPESASPDAATWASDARTRLADTDAALAARFDRNADIDDLLRDRTRAVDAIVRDAWSRCVPDDAPLASFAVGGYGRGELYPQSDIDLLVLADAGAQATQQEALACFFALLWDAGLPVGHAVRSPEECTTAALRSVR